MPGVASAGASNLIPLDGGGDVSRVEVPGKTYDAGREPRLFYAGVTAHYLDALGATLLRGPRTFTEQESRHPLEVAVINVSMARSLLRPRPTRTRRCRAFPRIGWPAPASWARSTRWAAQFTLLDESSVAEASP